MVDDVSVILEAERLTLRYGETVAVDDVSLRVPERRVTAIIGPSGCGKSTLLRTFNRMNDFVESFSREGRVLYRGDDLYGSKVDPVAVRRRIGMVFQKPNPFPRSVYKNISWGPSINGYSGDMDELVEKSLRRAALWDEVKDNLDKSGFELSGGQQQRLCIARAIAMSPEVILMDEPCSALDPASTTRIEDLMLELKERYTIVIVTHNMQQASRASDYTAFLYEGALIEFGTTQDVFTRPKRKRTEDYVTGRFAASRAIVVVARDVGDIESLMSALQAGLIISGLLLVAGAAILAYLATGRALLPLAQLREQVEVLGTALHERILLPGTPVELSPVIEALNTALDRIEGGLARERRLASHLAHELRTPIAELQAITAVARRWPRDKTLQMRCVEQGHEIARHMTHVVSALLRVARAESGEIALETEQLYVSTLLNKAWRRLEVPATDRGQKLLVEASSDLCVTGDPEVMDAIISNLLQNASEHAPEGSVIQTSGRRVRGAVELTISNPVGGRGGPASHARVSADDPAMALGLGLPLVSELTRVAGIGFQAKATRGSFWATLAFPVDASKSRSGG